MPGGWNGPEPDEMGLRMERQRLFVHYYLIRNNASWAAREAGYSEKTAYSIGHELLKKPEIQAAIKAEKARIAKKLEVTKEKVLAEYAKLAFANYDEFYDEDGNMIPVHKLPKELSACISSITETEQPLKDGTVKKTTKVTLWDKKGSVDSLGRYLGIFEKDQRQGRSQTIVHPPAVSKPRDSGT